MIKAMGLVMALGLGLALTQMARAADASPDKEAAMRQAALQSCQSDLDHDRFGDYTTMDDCVDAKVQKMKRTQAAAGTTPKTN